MLGTLFPAVPVTSEQAPRMMNTKHVVAVVATLIPLIFAKELAVDMQLKAQLFDSGLRHGEIVSLKEVRVTASLGPETPPILRWISSISSPD